MSASAAVLPGVTVWTQQNEARHTELQRGGQGRSKEEDKEYYTLFKTKASILKPGSERGTYTHAREALSLLAGTVLPGVTTWAPENAARLTELATKRRRRSEEEEEEYHDLRKTKRFLTTGRAGPMTPEETRECHAAMMAGLAKEQSVEQAAALQALVERQKESNMPECRWTFR